MHLEEFALFARSFCCTGTDRGIWVDLDERVVSELEGYVVAVGFLYLLDYRKIALAGWALKIAELYECDLFLACTNCMVTALALRTLAARRGFWVFFPGEHQDTKQTQNHHCKYRYKLFIHISPFSFACRDLIIPLQI